MNIRNQVCGFGYPFIFPTLSTFPPFLFKTILKFYVMIFGVILWKLPSANIYDVLFPHWFFVSFVLLQRSVQGFLRDSKSIYAVFSLFYVM